MSQHNPFRHTDRSGNGISEVMPSFPAAEFHFDELEKSFRGFLAGALFANEDAKTAVSNLASFGSPIDLWQNADAINVALKKWQRLLSRDIDDSIDGRLGVDPEETEQSLFKGTGIPRRIPTTGVDEQSVSLTDRINRGEASGDMKTQLELVEEMVKVSDFKQLKSNIRSLTASVTTDMGLDDDDFEMSPS